MNVTLSATRWATWCSPTILSRLASDVAHELENPTGNAKPGEQRAHAAYTRRRRRAPGSAQGHTALAHRDEPQGHRHAVPVLQLCDVSCRWPHGTHHSCRAIPAGAADRAARILQRAHHAARSDHGVRSLHAGVRGLRELAAPDDDRGSRYGIPAAEQFQLLAAAPGRD